MNPSKIVKTSFAQCLPLPSAQDFNLRSAVEGKDWKNTKANSGTWGNCTFFPTVDESSNRGSFVMIYYGPNPIMVAEPGFPSSDPNYYRGGWAGEDADYYQMSSGVKCNAHIYSIDLAQVERVLSTLKFPNNVGYITFIATDPLRVINGNSWELAMYACAAGLNPQAYTGAVVDADQYTLADLPSKMEIAKRAGRLLYAPYRQVIEKQAGMTTVATAPGFQLGTRPPEGLILYENVGDLCLSQYANVLEKTEAIKEASKAMSKNQTTAILVSGDTVGQIANNIFDAFLAVPTIARIESAIPAWVQPGYLFDLKEVSEQELADEIMKDMTQKFGKGPATAMQLLAAARNARKSFQLMDPVTLQKRYDSFLRLFFTNVSAITSDVFPLGGPDAGQPNAVKAIIDERKVNPILGRAVVAPAQKRARPGTMQDPAEISRAAKARNEAQRQATLDSLRQMYQQNKS